jgi:hypothetical protein
MYEVALQRILIRDENTQYVKVVVTSYNPEDEWYEEDCFVYVKDVFDNELPRDINTLVVNSIHEELINPAKRVLISLNKKLKGACNYLANNNNLSQGKLIKYAERISSLGREINTIKFDISLAKYCIRAIYNDMLLEDEYEIIQNKIDMKIDELLEQQSTSI